MSRKPVWQCSNQCAADNSAVSNVGLRFVMLPLDKPIPIHPCVAALNLATMHVCENMCEGHGQDGEAVGLLQSVAREKSGSNTRVIDAVSATMLWRTIRKAPQGNLWR
jgi:hypothetical protein